MLNSMETNQRIWGLEFEEIISDGTVIWCPIVRNPFMKDGRYRVGLNEKFLVKARERGVSWILLRIGQQERQLNLPDKKAIRVMVKRGDFEDRPSMFAGSPPMRVYYFTIT